MSLIGGYAPIVDTRRGHKRRGWLDHVENYSARQLTFEDDKLTALSGLAARLQQTTNDTYVAGLWWKYLIEDLCWRTYPINERPTQGTAYKGFTNTYEERNCYMSRAAKYRAPTWSWVSLNGQVNFLAVDFSRCRATALDYKIKGVSSVNALGSLQF